MNKIIKYANSLSGIIMNLMTYDLYSISITQEKKDKRKIRQQIIPPIATIAAPFEKESWLILNYYFIVKDTEF